MEQDDTVYVKQNSFVEIRHRRSLSDALPRIKRLRENFNAMSLTPEQKNVLKAALEEILEESRPGSNVSPFTLHLRFGKAPNVKHKVSSDTDRRLTPPFQPRKTFLQFNDS